jgi:hypothetical protein
MNADRFREIRKENLILCHGPTRTHTEKTFYIHLPDMSALVGVRLRLIQTFSTEPENFFVCVRPSVSVVKPIS